MAIWKMAVIGLEKRDLALLETAIDLASGLEIGRWEVVDEPEIAQVILANLDNPDGKSVSDQYDFSQSNTLVVPYSASADMGSISGLTLSSPLSYKNVTSLLKTLESELVSPVNKTSATIEKPQAKSPLNSATNIQQINPADIVKHKIDWLSDDETVDVDEGPLLTEITSPPANTTSTEKTTPINPTRDTDVFAPDSRLLGLIFNIIEKGKTAQISHKKYPELRIFPDNGWFVFTEELDSYPEMFREQAESFSIEILDEEIKDELFSGRLPQSLWKLLFTAALFGSEGRLLEHQDQEKPFHLIHTPYFGMIPHTADHITIAEYMVNNNSEIETIHNDTNIDIETIIDFCNACDAIQLLQNEEISDPVSNEFNSELTDITALENDTTVESEIDRDNDDNTEKQKKSGLINSIWSNLTKT